MSAWPHYKFWTDDLYEVTYRKYVMDNAEKYEGDTADCADLSMTLLIEFAAANGLPLTFYDNAGVRYISKGERQSPRNILTTYGWKDKASYLHAVKYRIGAKSLLKQNMEPNVRGPQPGDLMIKEDHAALVFRVWPARMPHPLAPQCDKKGGIPLFPADAEQAKTELNQTKYFRDSPFGPVPSPWPHIDYLNHRGYGKEKAEIMYFADVQAMRNDKFEFRRYRKLVRDNWDRWDGSGDPPQ